MQSHLVADLSQFEKEGVFGQTLINYHSNE